jgi:hypothetical protein
MKGSTLQLSPNVDVYVTQRFAELQVVGPAFLLPMQNGHRKSYVVCKCACGQFTVTRTNKLKTGHTKSCGCLQRNGPVQHGGCGTRLYNIWKGMRSRCNNPNTKDYTLYGAKGIRVVRQWDTFEPFRVWAISKGYKDELVLDRIDPTGHYGPTNCQWLTPADNSKKVWSQGRGWSQV